MGLFDFLILIASLDIRWIRRHRHIADSYELLSEGLSQLTSIGSMLKWVKTYL